MITVMFGGTLLGALVFAFFGVLLESRLPAFADGAYDNRIAVGWIGVVAATPDAVTEATATEVLHRAGATDIIRPRRGDTPHA